MSLRPGLLWLTLNLALIIQCVSRNNIFSQFYTLRKMSSRTPRVCVLWVEDHCDYLIALRTIRPMWCNIESLKQHLLFFKVLASIMRIT
jgi:hypothetical protein